MSNYSKSPENINKIKENTEKSFHPHFVHNTPDRVAFDLSLTINDLRIYMTIRSFMDTTGDAYPSNNWMANRLGIDRRTVITCISRLIEKGYIGRREINGQRHLFIRINSTPEVVISGSPPSDLEITPPSDLEITQLDQNTIKPKTITTTTNHGRENFDKSSSDLLKLRDRFLQRDKRTNEEFINQCCFKLKESEKNGFSKPEAFRGLEKIITSGCFETPKGYKSITPVETSPQEAKKIYDKAYKERMAKYGADLGLDLSPLLA